MARFLQSDASISTDPIAIRWSPTFSATGLTFTGSNSTYPTYNSYYVNLLNAINAYFT